MGDATGAQPICARHAPNIHCLVDEAQQTYHAYGVGKATLSAMMAPSVFREAISVVPQYGMGDTNGGDVSQMPATFVIAPSGRFLLTHYSRTIADYPKDAQLISALQGAGVP